MRSAYAVMSEWYRAIDHAEPPRPRRSPILFCVLAALRGIPPRLCVREGEIQHEAQTKGDEPGVRVERVEERRVGDLAVWRHRGPDEPRDDWQDRHDQRGDGAAVDPVAVRIPAVDAEQVGQR